MFKNEYKKMMGEIQPDPSLNQKIKNRISQPNRFSPLRLVGASVALILLAVFIINYDSFMSSFTSKNQNPETTDNGGAVDNSDDDYVENNAIKDEANQEYIGENEPRLTHLKVTQQYYEDTNQLIHVYTFENDEVITIVETLETSLESPKSVSITRENNQLLAHFTHKGSEFMITAPLALEGQFNLLIEAIQSR